MTRLKWKLISIRLKIVLILTQDRCIVYAEHTIGSEIVFDTPDRKVMWVMSNLISVHLEMVLVLVQDRCTVCAERTNHSGHTR
jgi:uncharacterized protein with PIN domain